MVVPFSAVLLATMTRMALTPLAGPSSHHVFYAAAIIVSLLHGGLRPALFAGLLSVLVNVAFLFGDEDLHLQIPPLMGFLAICVVLAYRASTLRKQAEQKVQRLTHTTKDLERLLDSASDFAICMLDRNGAVVHWSKGAERLTGWSEAAAMEQDIGIFYALEDRAAGKPAMDLKWAMLTGRHAEERRRAKMDGSLFTGDMCITSIRDDSGAIIGFGISLRDVSAERELYRRVRTQEMQFRSILSAVPEAMVAVDENGRIQMFTAQAQQMFGYSEQEVVGLSPDLLFALPWSIRVRRYLRMRSRSPDCKPARLIAVRRDGTLFPVEATMGSADTEAGRWYAAFLRDLTEQEETRSKMEALQLDVLHGSRLGAMGIMASTLAHELNQPMTAMTNYLEGCRAQLKSMDGAQIKKLDKILERASSEAVRAGRIIGHIREFVARGETTLAIEDGNSIVTSAGTLIAGAAKQAGVSVAFDLADIGSVFVDRVQVHQVLVNLINNAIDAMRSGAGAGREIMVSTQLQDDEFVRISVEDHAGGLKPEVRDKLFQAFTSAGKEGGLGLGLSICRTIIEAHGGKIWAEDLGHGGTRFNFTLSRFAGELSYAA